MTWFKEDDMVHFWHIDSYANFTHKKTMDKLKGKSAPRGRPTRKNFKKSKGRGRPPKRKYHESPQCDNLPSSKRLK